MERKHVFYLCLAALVVASLFCLASGASVGGQMSSMAQSAALVEQARANQEMAHALRTQANASVWTTALLVIGLLVALGGGVWLGLQVKRPAQTSALPLKPLREIPTSEMPALPEGADELTAVEWFELLTAGDEWLSE